jgi:flap endonuclease-1
VPRLIRNLTVTGRRKLPGRDQYVQVSPEMICLKDVLDQNKITYDQLVLLCLLVGNDFEPGIKGIGPKKALNLVKKYPTLDKLYASKEVGQDLKDIGLDLYQVEEIFKKPDIDKEYDISFKSLMPEKIVNLLCDKHDFSRDRVEKAIDKILKAKNKSSQTRLTAY